MRDRDDLFLLLKDLGIETETVEHARVFTVAEARSVRKGAEGGHFKNLFLKDKKGALWLVSSLEDTAIDLKTLPKLIGSARLSFGKAELLHEILGVSPGSVTPFALMNDRTNRVRVVLDNGLFAHDILHFHPLSNDATTLIKRDDFLLFLRSVDHEPLFIDFKKAGGIREA